MKDLIKALYQLDPGLLNEERMPASRTQWMTCYRMELSGQWLSVGGLNPMTGDFSQSPREAALFFYLLGEHIVKKGHSFSIASTVEGWRAKIRTANGSLININGDSYHYCLLKAYVDALRSLRGTVFEPKKEAAPEGG